MAATTIVVIAFAAVVGCATTKSSEKRREREEQRDRENRPVEQAAFDLDCSEPELEWAQLGSNEWGVRGCGRRGRYIRRCERCGAEEFTYRCNCQYELQGCVRSAGDSREASSGE